MYINIINKDCSVNDMKLFFVTSEFNFHCHQIDVYKLPFSSQSTQKHSSILISLRRLTYNKVKLPCDGQSYHHHNLYCLVIIINPLK